MMNSTKFSSQIKQRVNAQPHPLLFITISGEHLYGFCSANNDYGLRGVHVLPAQMMLGPETGAETIEEGGVYVSMLPGKPHCTICSCASARCDVPFDL